MGRKKPKAMVEKPLPGPGNTLFQQAFYDLDGERQIGMSVGKIPWSAVRYYAQINEFSNAQTIALHYLIARMDAANLKHMADSIKKGK
jgi:hypothetical protein